MEPALITAEDVRTAAIAANLSFVPRRACSICDEEIGYSIHHGNLYFDRRCGCSSLSQPEPREWQTIADDINNMQDLERQVVLMRNWGLLKTSTDDGWQPIDTAPKDGTILVFEDTCGTLVDVARWNAGEWNSVFGKMGDGCMTRWRIAGI